MRPVESYQLSLINLIIAGLVRSDFRSLVESIQRRGVRVTVVSSLVTQPPMVADELRRQADVFIDIAELRSKIGRDVHDRPACEPRGPRDSQMPQFIRRDPALQRSTVGVEDDFED